uniref:DM domain-containing protein n=1 Tax=Schistocephalus solidus TaxID=70667 RepID=A0A0X3PYM2_SCHSO
MQPTMYASVYGRSDIHASTASHTSLPASSEFGGIGLTLTETLFHPSTSPAQATDFGFRRHQFPHFRDDNRRYCDAVEVPPLETGVARVCDFDTSKSSACLPGFHPPTQLYTAMAIGSDAVAAAAAAADSVVALETSLGRLRSPHFGVSAYQQSHSLVSHQLPPAQPPSLQTVPAQSQLSAGPQSSSTARICQLFNNINRPAFYATTSEKMSATPSLEFAYDNDCGAMVGNSAVGQPFEYASMLHLSAPLHLQSQKAGERIRDSGDKTITTDDSSGTSQQQQQQQQQVTKLRPENRFVDILSQVSSSSSLPLTVSSSCSAATSRRRPALEGAHTDRRVGRPLFAATTGQFSKEGNTGDFTGKLEGSEETTRRRRRRRPDGSEGSVSSEAIAESTPAGAGVVFAPVNAARSSYMCRKCRAHGRLVPVRQHKRNCPYKHCNCSVCSLVNYGRHIVAKQIALYRDQKNHQLALVARSTGDNESAVDGKRRGSDGKERLLTGPTERPPKATAMVEEEGPHCRRCRNHGKTNPWKGHKKVCPFYYCICQQCILITLRKSNEKNN